MRIEDLKGFIDFPGGFQLLKGQPIDSRYVGEDLEFLQSIIDIGAAYPGLKVFIKSENKSYIYRKGTNGEYGFNQEEVTFTDQEREVLSSGITKEKVSEFEGKYKIPESGIPEIELSKEVRNKLSLAENSVQEEKDPTVPSWAKQKEKPKYDVSEIAGLEEALEGKVPRDGDKVLTDENFSMPEKIKLSEIEERAQVNVVEEVYVNGRQQRTTSKRVDIQLKTVNGEVIDGEGDLGLVSISKDQNVSGNKTFTSEISIPAKTSLNLDEARSRSAATEAQVASAIRDLGDILTNQSQLNASKLYGDLPSNLNFPRLNQDTTGEAGSAKRLSTPRYFSLKGKVSSGKFYFDGRNDLEIEVDSISQNPLDYPTLNQDTTGRSGSADKLSSPRKLKVNLGLSGDGVGFDGSNDAEDIPVKGRISLINFIQGQGTGTSRRVLSTDRGVEVGDLKLSVLTPSDVGLGNVINERQATESQLNLLKDRVTKLEILGSFVGSYETYLDLPKTTGGILGKYGVEATVNDFVTVRSGPYMAGSGIPDDSATCWSIVNIDQEGNITWAYEYTYNFDISGKIDKVVGEDTARKVPVITESGGIASSGVGVNDFILAESLIYEGGPTYIQKIRDSLTAEDIIKGSYSLIHPGTSDPCKHGNRFCPVYFENGTPVTCTNIASVNDDGKVVGLDSDNNPTVELKIEFSAKSDLAERARSFVNEKGDPSTQGGSLQPIYLDGDGKPKAIARPLGDMAFENILISGHSSWELVTDKDKWEIGTLRVYHRKGHVPEGSDGYGDEDRFQIEFINEMEAKKSWYGLICPEIDSGFSGSVFDGSGKLKSLLKSLFNIQDLSLPTANEDGVYEISKEAHGLSSFARVRIYEISGFLGNSKNDLRADDVRIVENFGMATVSLSNNVSIETNSMPYYDSSAEVSQGIYLVEISE